MLPFLYPLWYIPTVNVWTWTSQNHQKSSLGKAAGLSDSFPFQLFRPIMTFTRATCKQQSTPAHFQHSPSKEKTQNKQEMQEVERRCREKPNRANQELALMSHMWKGEFSAFEVRQQLTQAARNSHVPPWQGLSHPQNQVCSADLEKSWLKANRL